jgi:hypothetical protein
LFVKLIEVLALPNALFIRDDEFRFLDIERDRIRGICLQFNGVSAGLRGGLHDFQGALQGLIVIAGHLRDDEWPMGGADLTACNLETCIHETSVFGNRTSASPVTAASPSGVDTVVLRVARRPILATMRKK